MTTPDPVRVARIISRLNVGGPAIQAISVTKLLEEREYQTLLIRGSEELHEGSMDDLAEEYGVRPLRIPSMRREVGRGDAVAFGQLVRVLRRFRPDIVHTHAAKAGTLGRAATLAAFPRDRPMIVHTYHGHSLSGYFGTRREQLFTAIERGLGRRTDRLIAVSAEVRDDLLEFGVGSPARFAVIPLGLALTPFVAGDAERSAMRQATRGALGIGLDERVVLMVARLVPIKRVDRLLRVASLVPDARILIAGDGELRDQLQALPEARALGDRVSWLGMRGDIAQLLAAADVVVQTSDNEGTPVSLIEAGAGAKPVVSTRVGGTESVVIHERTGLLCAVEDEAGLAASVRRILDAPQWGSELGRAGREHVLSRFARDRLVDDLDQLYRELLLSRASAPTRTRGSSGPG